MHNLHPAMDSMCTARARPMDNGNAVAHSPYTTCTHPAHSRISVQVIHPFHTTAAVYGTQRASRLIPSSWQAPFFPFYGQGSACCAPARPPQPAGSHGGRSCPASGRRRAAVSMRPSRSCARYSRRSTSFLMPEREEDRQEYAFSSRTRRSSMLL